MENVPICLIGVMLICASIYTMLSCKSCQPFVDYQNSLDDELKQLHQQSVSERQNLYLQGLIIGSIIGMGFLYWNKGTINPMQNSCLFVAITMIIQYLYYITSKKQIVMLDKLKTKEQTQNWWKVYKHMQMRYHTGLLLGLIGYFIVGKWFSEQK